MRNGWPAELAAAGKDRTEIEHRLAGWQFHPAVAFAAANDALVAGGSHNGNPGPSGAAV